MKSLFEVELLHFPHVIKLPLIYISGHLGAETAGTSYMHNNDTLTAYKVVVVKVFTNSCLFISSRHRATSFKSDIHFSFSSVLVSTSSWGSVCCLCTRGESVMCVSVSDCLLVSRTEVVYVRFVVDICLFMLLCIRVKMSARINVNELASVLSTLGVTECVCL